MTEKINKTISPFGQTQKGTVRVEVNKAQALSSLLMASLFKEPFSKISTLVKHTEKNIDFFTTGLYYCNKVPLPAWFQSMLICKSPRPVYQNIKRRQNMYMYF